MKINVTRKHLLVAIIVLGCILVGYAVLKFAFGINFGEFVAKNLPLAIIVCAVVIFGWNRHLLALEKTALEAEEAKKKAAETSVTNASTSAEASPDSEPKV